MARRRIILIHAGLMVQWLQQDGHAISPSTGAWVKSITSDCPVDLRVVGVGWDELRNQIRVAVESAEFDEVPEGCFAPEWTPTYTAHYMDRFEAAMEVLGRTAS